MNAFLSECRPIFDKWIASIPDGEPNEATKNEIESTKHCWLYVPFSNAFRNLYEQSTRGIVHSRIDGNIDVGARYLELGALNVVRSNLF